MTAYARLAPLALLAWIVGSAAQLQQTELATPGTYVLMGVLALGGLLASLRLSSDSVVRSMVCMLATATLAYGLTGLRSATYSQNALESGLEGQDVVVRGVVASMVQYNESGLRFRLDVSSATLAGAPVKLPPRLYLSWYAGPVASTAPAGASGAGLVLQRAPMSMHAGDDWQLAVRLKSPHGGSNPHGFDYELWLWEQGIQATGYVRAGPRDPPPQRLDATWQHPIEQIRQRVRDAVFERIADRKMAGVIAALVVGDQGAIDRADWDVFRATGVAHLMSISGLHITMFAWAAALLVGFLWRRSGPLCLAVPAPVAAIVGGLALASAYAIFSGWGIPAQRTILMLATVGLLRCSGKTWPWPIVWLLACWVVVLADPWALLQAGFWLSFVAVGVLFATDPASHTSVPPDLDKPPTAQRHRPVGWLWLHTQTLWREQWVISLTLAPLTLLLFGQVSLVGLVANLVAIPWVTLVVTPMAMAGAFIPSLWQAASAGVQVMITALQWFANWPLATISVAQAPIWAGVAGVLGGILLLLPSPWHLRLMGLPLILPVLLWQSPRPPPGHFELLMADVGQGNAVLVRTASHALVYDSGPRFSRESDAGHRVVVPLLRALDVHVDSLVLSHRDADHTGGAAAILAMQPNARLVSSIEASHELQTLRKSARCMAGQRWSWDGVDFEFLHPEAADYDSAVKSNGMSCVLRISNGQQTALLAGDIEEAQERRLLSAPETQSKLKANLLLVPHHGSKTSSSAAFLDAVQPRIGFVQSGYRNRFGHPASLVAQRYRDRGIQLDDSPHCGAATWHSNAPDALRCERDERRRYWHHRMR